MPMTLHPRVLELIASRICHDLVSPVGAIGNGVELIQDMGDDVGSEAMDLIANSAEQAAVQLKLFRLCYGAGGTDGNIGFQEIHDVYMAWLASSRITASFDEGMALNFSMPPRGFFKCLLNLLILTEECAHGEGSFAVHADDGHKGMTIILSGKQLGFRDGIEPALKGETVIDDLDPRSVHAYITGKFIAYFGFTLTWDVQVADNRMIFHLSF